ncbi:uncharacterized protein NEPG_02606 [Nematocida parisii ERTm1]|uniref:uncharacterized protein n=1 Tax=Nematocida parisii (strain ERTm1 / ATCC PRA-289) TaxID=881290 RepID=UPI000264B952|nr:uncharacterized protein NEPG_02606 [Nematocida parisii ERTm1]EIJ92537.1 hypothetical protein NEPG_02606 [Nematocida parisii ERTm1]|eukprot:XP_013060433.1 hypothetical protein NEPG_02606 [Nematocida parisii ERTm1]
MTGTVNGLFNREKAFLENLLAKHKKGTTNSVKQALKSEYEKAAKAVLNKGLRALSIEVQFMQNVKKGIMWFIDLLESGGIKRYKSLEGAQSKCLFTNYLNNEIANQARKYNTSELDTSTGKPIGTILDSSSKGSSTINRGTDSESAQNKPQPYVYNESHNLLRDFDNNIIGAINRMPAEKKAETIEWLKRGLAASELQISLNSTAGPESLLHPESSLLFQPSAQKRVSEKIKEAVEEIKKTSEKNSAMEKRITELEKEAAAQDAALSKISKDTADLTNSASEMENTASALDKDIAAFDKTVQSLKKQIEQQKEQEKARKGAIGDLKKKNEQEWSSINTLLGTGEITARGKNKKGTKKTELVSADIKKSTQEIKQLLKGMEDKAAALKKQRNTSEKRTDEALSKIKNYPKLEGAIKKMCRVEISMDAASKKGKKSSGKSSNKQPLAHTVTTAICDAAKKTNSPHEKALCSLSVKDICAEDSKEKSELQKSLEKCEKQPSLKSDIQKQENTVQQQIKDIQGLSDSIKFTAQLLNDTEKAILLARESKERERASFSETVAHLEEALKQPLQAVINTLQDAKQHMPLAEDLPFVLSETDSGGIDSSIRSLDKAINSLRLLNTYMYQRSDKLMDESQECQMSLSEATEEPTTEEQERIRPTEITSTLKTENVSILETTSEETLAPTVASNNSISKSSLPSIPEEPTTTEEVISTAETIIPTVPAIDESITITEKAVDETPATEKSFVGTETFIPTLSTIDESINTAEESLPEEYTGAEENLSTTPTETNPAILETSCNTTDEIPSTEYFDINDLDDIFKITMSGELTPEEKIKPLFTCEETETDPLTSPEISSSPSVPTTSEIPTTVKIPTTPKVSSSSSIPTTSETPTTPKVSSSPSVLTTSEIPTTSETPTTPKVSSSPSVPTTSEIPTTVETPAISASPVLPTVPLAVGTILPSAIEKNKTTENKTKRPRTKIKLGPRLHKNNTYVNRPLQIENIL